MTDLNLVTVVPARAGSKGLPGKNTRLLGGKPLLVHSIEYSLRCTLVRRTVVSTDSEETAQIARSFGADVPFLRPTEHAQDLVQDYPVMRHALETLEEIYDERIDAIVLLRPTSPLRAEGLIERAVALIETHPDWSSVRAVAPISEHPYRMWVLTPPYMEGFIRDIEEPYNKPRQIIPELHVQTGDLEVIRRETLLEECSASGRRIVPLMLSEWDRVDIDHPEDLRQAERVLTQRGKAGTTS